MKKTLSIVLALALLLGFMPGASAALKASTGIGAVTTAYGDITGVFEDGVTRFKGVPYAQPPVGDLRWQAPQPLQAWGGVYAADTYAAISPQYPDQGAGSAPYDLDFYWDGMPDISEDCLYLNITTSSTTGEENMPVFIWFHGGGLRHGWSYENEFDGETLAKKGVVVVTVGTRLGVFGYMSLPQLTEEQGQSGNYGLMDEIAALKWVKENIAAFGGDPERITVGGQSGGASKTMALSISPEAPDLYGIIMQSGLQWTAGFGSQGEAEQNGQKYLEVISADPNATLEELRALDTSVLLAQDSATYVANTPGSMVKDGKYIVTDSAAEAVEAGAWDGVNILSGTVLGEAIGATEMAAAEFYAYYKEQLGDLYEAHRFEDLVQVTDETAGTVRRELATYGMFGGSNSRRLMVNRLLGAYRSARETNTGSTWSYVFTHFTPSRPEEAGTTRDMNNLWAWHSSDLWYTFGSLDLNYPPVRDWQAYDYMLKDIASDYWSNFMKTGNPNGDNLPVWPKADDSYAYMEIGDEVVGHTEFTKLDELIKAAVQPTIEADYGITLK